MQIQGVVSIWEQINTCFQTWTDTREKYFFHFKKMLVFLYRWPYTQLMASFTQTTVIHNNSLFMLLKQTVGNNHMCYEN